MENFSKQNNRYNQLFKFTNLLLNSILMTNLDSIYKIKNDKKQDKDNKDVSIEYLTFFRTKKMSVGCSDI